MTTAQRLQRVLQAPAVLSDILCEFCCLQKDLEYWQIDELILEPCCALKYYPEIELCVKEQKGEQEAKAKETQRLKDENFGSSRWGRVRTYLWNVMEYPETSRTAQVMNGKMRLTPELFVVRLPFSQTHILLNICLSSPTVQTFFFLGKP